MKTYKHKTTNWVAKSIGIEYNVTDENNNFIFKFPLIMIENTNDWELIFEIKKVENYLENKDILSDEILKVMKKLIDVSNNEIVFGGSIVLNALGLIKRPIHDVDIFIDKHISIYGGLDFFIHNEIDDELIYESVTDINGIPINRISIKIDGINVCIFSVQTLNYSSFKLNDKDIKIQNINEAILAKRAYLKITEDRNKNTITSNYLNLSYEKHKKDVQDIDEFLNKIM